MNLSFGTSNFPRCDQYDCFTKSAPVYLGGTGIGSVFGSLVPASSARCASHTDSHSARLRSPDPLYRNAERYGTPSGSSNVASDCAVGAPFRPTHMSNASV